MPGLLMHCGDNAVDRETLRAIPVPAPTSTWMPISHVQLLEQVESALPRHGLSVVSEAYAVTSGGSRFFGLLEVQSGHQNQEYAMVLGIRNAHDKRFPAGLVVGSQITVCTNLAFSGEICVTRKHTRFVLRDLPGLIDDAVGQLADRWREQDVRIDRYKNHRIRNSTAHDIVVQALDAGIITSTRIPDLLAEWRAPRYVEFRPRTLWSLHNAFTETMKGRLYDLPWRTRRLNELCDERCGLNAA